MNLINYIRVIFIIIIFGFLITVAYAENDIVSVTYKSYIDPGYGFYKMRDITTYKAAPYDVNNKTLTIKQGDIVSWVNDADTAVTLSIVSEQNLWSGSAKLEKTYKFDVPGKYTFYIKEYQSRRQTIIVEAIDGYPVSTPGEIPTTVVTTYPTSTPVSVSTDIIPVPVATPYPIKIKNVSQTPNVDIPDISVVKFPDIKLPDVKIPIKISPTMIASVIVAILSIIITYRVGKNR